VSAVRRVGVEGAPELVRQLLEVDGNFALLVTILILAAIVVDAILGGMKRLRRDTGITRRMVVKAVEGGSFVPAREFYSHRLGLAGRPDALVEEGGILIPIERKAFGKRPADKDIAQLLVYCRLIEEQVGIRPSHGYLILGPAAKRWKIENNPERQEWLDGVLLEMRRVLEGGPCVATPHPRKCSGCGVREGCEVRR
jgi:CRISPR/Cas system-associated exonuclease Cas4 (RecB family)